MLRLIDDYENGHAPVHANTNQAFRASISPSDEGGRADGGHVITSAGSSPEFGSASYNCEENDLNTDTTALLSDT